MNNEEKRYYIYTNDAGKTLFIKKDLFDDLRISDAQRFIGEPINKVLGIDQQWINNWIEQAKITRQLNNVKTEIRFFGSTDAIPVLLDFSVVMDEHQNFQGVDISVRFIEPGEPIDLVGSAPKPQTGKLTKLPDETEVLAQYFVERVIALRVMTLRMGGIRLGKGLDSVFNHFASKRFLGVRSMDGNLELAAVKELTPSQMKDIFSHLEEYIAGVTSAALVKTVIEELTVKTDRRNLEIITRLLA